MPNALVDAHAFNFSALLPVGLGDINQASTSPKYTPGGVAFLNTAFGPRLVKYNQNRTTAVVQGALLSGVGGTDGKTAVTASAGKVGQITTSGLTANAHVGAIAYCLDNNDAAGAAPEGEASIVKANTATIIDLEDDLPFSVAVAASDTFSLISTYNAEEAADGDLAAVVQGVVMGKDGIGAGAYGFVSQWGVTPNTLLKASTALTSGDALVADAGRVGPATGSADAGNLHVGYTAVVVTSDTVSDKFPAFMMLGFGVTPATLDISA